MESLLHSINGDISKLSIDEINQCTFEELKNPRISKNYTLLGNLQACLREKVKHALVVQDSTRSPLQENNALAMMNKPRSTNPGENKLVLEIAQLHIEMSCELLTDFPNISRINALIVDLAHKNMEIMELKRTT